MLFISLSLENGTMLFPASILIMLIITHLAIYRHMKRKKDDGSVFVSGRKNKVRSFFATYMGVFAFGGIFLLLKLIENHSIAFSLSAVWICILLFIDLYILNPKLLIINDKGIRCPLRWTLKWTELKDWNIDEDTKTVLFTTSDDKTYSFPSVREDDISKIRQGVRLHLEPTPDIVCK